MQGQSSSLAVWTALLTQSTAIHNKVAHRLKIAWLRGQTSASFATVGTSTVGGDDLIKGPDDVAVTKPDLFDYFDETDKALVLEYEQSIEEPIGGIVYGWGNMVLDNTDKRFTRDIDSTIGTAIKPNRPTKFSIGYFLPQMGINKTLPIFKGLTGAFKENKKTRIVEAQGSDYISFINDKQIESSVYQDQRTDQILQDILVNELGFSSDQIALDEGLNTIGFAWFDRNEKVGDRIKKIVESEEGRLYQDEFGIVRFETRRHWNQSPHTSSIHNIDAGDIIEWEELESSKIINACKVIGRPREIENDIEVWRLGFTEEIPRGVTKTIWADFEDPVTNIDSVTIDANTASDGTGTDISGNMNVTVTTFTKAAKIEIENTTVNTAYIRFLKLTGDAAVVSSKVEQMYQDDDSINAYDRREMIYENNFIDDDDFAYYLARAIVRKFKLPRRQIRITIRGVPQLQVGDYITVEDFDTGTSSDYRILKISGSLSPGEFIQKINLREISDSETDAWATIGTSTIGGEDVIGI